MENDGLFRVNIRVPVETKEWFQKEAKRYGTTMSALMAFVMVNYKEQKDSAKALSELSKQSEGITVDEIMKGIKELTERFGTISDKGEQNQ